MSREQMVEKAARAAHSQAYTDGQEGKNWDKLESWVRGSYRDDARAALDAILPQITTVDELEALPVGTLLKADDGDAWERMHRGWD